MSDKEIQGLIQNAFQKTLKEFQENPDNVFNYLELQEKYNRVLKDKVNLQKESQKYKEVIDRAIDKLYCCGESLNPDFQKEMLTILKEVSRD